MTEIVNLRALVEKTDLSRDDRLATDRLMERQFKSLTGIDYRKSVSGWLSATLQRRLAGGARHDIGSSEARGSGPPSRASSRGGGCAASPLRLPRMMPRGPFSADSLKGKPDRSARTARSLCRSHLQCERV